MTKNHRLASRALTSGNRVGSCEQLTQVYEGISSHILGQRNFLHSSMNQARPQSPRDPKKLAASLDLFSVCLKTRENILAASRTPTDLHSNRMRKLRNHTGRSSAQACQRAFFHSRARVRVRLSEGRITIHNQTIRQTQKSTGRSSEWPWSCFLLQVPSCLRASFAASQEFAVA